MLKLYENIKLYRQLKGWSQDELAAKVGYGDRTIISKIERGDVDLSQSKIIKFAEVFGISSGELMGNDGCATPSALPAGSVKKFHLLDEWGIKAVVDTIDHEYERCKGQEDLMKKRQKVLSLDKITTKEQAKLIYSCYPAAFNGALEADDEHLIQTADSVLQDMKDMYK